MKYALNLLFILSLAFVSCKGDKAKDATVGEATKVEAKGSDVSAPVDTQVSSVLWKGSKPAGTHTGTINIKSGNIDLKDGKVVGGTVLIDMNTITVTDLEGDGKADLEAHLKGTTAGKEDHFFNVAKFPEAKFEITKVINLVNDETANSLVSGNLTLKDVTKQIGFKAQIDVYEDVGHVRVTTPEFSINRTDWGIQFMSKNFFDDLKDKFIDDDIQISIRLKAGA